MSKPQSNLKAFQDEVGAWGEETFGHSLPLSCHAHLVEEVAELRKDLEAVSRAEHDASPKRPSHAEIQYLKEQAATETADCMLILLHIAHKLKFDLLKVAQEKMQRNRKRTWGKPDENGVIEHTAEGEVL